MRDSNSHEVHNINIVLGLSNFFLLFRGLKFTKTVPVMSSIGNTFSNTVVDVAMFMCVMGVMFLAFGVVFFLLYSTSQLNAFNTLGKALFAIFRG